MEVKDQLKIRMDELKITPAELARRMAITAQSVRYWLSGRSFPGKAKTAALESALTFKLNFSSATNEHQTTVEDSLRQTDIETFLAITKLPPQLKGLFCKIAIEIATSLEPQSAQGAPSRAIMNTRGFVAAAKKSS